MDALDSFLMELNNATANLLVGRACWNHSIGNAFDPFEEPALEKVENKLSFILGRVDGFILQWIEGGAIFRSPREKNCPSIRERIEIAVLLLFTLPSTRKKRFGR